jgi:DinB superfamily
VFHSFRLVAPSFRRTAERILGTNRRIRGLSSARERGSMNRVMCLVCGLLLLASVAGAQPAAGRKVGLAMGLQFGYAGSKANLVAEVEKMPEGDFGFRPGAMPEVRTFGQLFAHVAAGLFGTCAAVKGVPDPTQGRNLEQELKTKAEFAKVLADSFAFCDDVFSSTTDENAAAFIRQCPNEITRATALYGLLAHNSEMYGIGTVYQRLKGIVPPSTERQSTGRGRGRGGQ